jgi:hypothetical protein
VEAGLRRVLVARNVPSGDWDDYLQEVAARALAADVAFHDADDLLPWATTVLRRMHVDLLRRREREGRAAVAVQPASAGVDHEVMARLDLAAVAEAVAAWSPEARAALLQEDGVTGTRQTSAFYVRRHRLRARLLATIEGAGVLGPFGALRTRLRLRRLELWRLLDWRRLDATLVEQATATAALMLPPVAAVCLSLVLGADPAAAPPRLPPSAVRLSSSALHVAGDGASAGAHASAHAAGGSAAGGDRDGTTGGRTAPAPPRKRLVRTPVETQVEYDAGAANPNFGVKDTDEPRPLLCVGGEAVPAECVPHPLYEGPAAGIVPPP